MRSWLGLCFVLALGCAHEGQVPAAWDATAVESLRIPGGKRCLSVLDQLGVKYEKLSPRGRVKTPVAIHGVHHVFHPPVLLNAWTDDDRRSRIVFITRGLAQQEIEEGWRRLCERQQAAVFPA